MTCLPFMMFQTRSTWLLFSSGYNGLVYCRLSPRSVSLRFILFHLAMDHVPGVTWASIHPYSSQPFKDSIYLEVCEAIFLLGMVRELNIVAGETRGDNPPIPAESSKLDVEMVNLMLREASAWGSAVISLTLRHKEHFGGAHHLHS